LIFSPNSFAFALDFDVYLQRLLSENFDGFVSVATHPFELSSLPPILCSTFRLRSSARSEALCAFDPRLRSVAVLIGR